MGGGMGMGHFPRYERLWQPRVWDIILVMPAKKYIASSVPRYLRQTKMGSLPINCIIGSYGHGEGDTRLIFDIIMLPAQSFQRVRNSMGAQLDLTLTPRPGGSAFMPSFIPKDAKEVTVPEGEGDPETYARDYFIKLFGLNERK